MSDSLVAVLGIGFLAGTITTITAVGVASSGKRKSNDDYHRIDSIPDGSRDRRSDNGFDKQARIIAQAKKLGVKLKGDE